MSCFFFCPKFPKKRPFVFLYEVVFPKLFRPKVFDFNLHNFTIVIEASTPLNRVFAEAKFDFQTI